jgi:hypothetical protein
MVRDTGAPAPGAVPQCYMHLARGGYRQQVTPEAVTSLGFPPSVLE